jgi:hypothetical protein
MMSPMYFWSHSYKKIGKYNYGNEGDVEMVVSLLKWMIVDRKNPNLTIIPIIVIYEI